MTCNWDDLWRDRANTLIKKLIRYRLRKMELPRLSIISNKSPVYSETFIKAHIEKLPAQISFFYGNDFPRYKANNIPITSYLFSSQLPRQWLETTIKIQKLRQLAFQTALKQNKTQAVLAEYGKMGVTVQPICQRLNIPLIVHFHGYDAYDDKVLKKLGQHYPTLFKQAAAIIAVSRDMEQQLLKLGAIPEKLHYNPYGVDVDLFKQTEPHYNPPIFLAVGRFVDKKAPYLTLLAFREVLKQAPEARLKMIGDGILLESCKQLAESLNLSEQVDFLGASSHEEVANTMQTVRAFVQHSVTTSYGDSEGTPVAVLEASASGLPVIATRHAGIKDVVVENCTGLLVNEGDIKAMAQRMIRLIQEPELATEMGQQARLHISHFFSMDKYINQLWKIIFDCF